MLYVADRKKKPEKKKFPIWLPSHPPSTIGRPAVFRCPITPKTSRSYAMWEGDLIKWEKKKKWGDGHGRAR